MTLGDLAKIVALEMPDHEIVKPNTVEIVSPRGGRSPVVPSPNDEDYA